VTLACSRRVPRAARGFVSVCERGRPFVASSSRARSTAASRPRAASPLDHGEARAPRARLRASADAVMVARHRARRHPSSACAAARACCGVRAHPRRFGAARLAGRAPLTGAETREPGTSARRGFAARRRRMRRARRGVIDVPVRGAISTCAAPAVLARPGHRAARRGCGGLAAACCARAGGRGALVLSPRLIAATEARSQRSGCARWRTRSASSAAAAARRDDWWSAALREVAGENLESSTDGRNLRFGIVVSRFNHLVSVKLLEAVMSACSSGACGRGHPRRLVPGAFEIRRPRAARGTAATTHRRARVVDPRRTPHFEYVCLGVTMACARWCATRASRRVGRAHGRRSRSGARARGGPREQGPRPRSRRSRWRVSRRACAAASAPPRAGRAPRTRRPR